MADMNLDVASAGKCGAMFVPEGDALIPTEWAVGPWSKDLLQASAYGGLLVRALERGGVAPDMMLSRLSFDLWRPVTRTPITTSVTVLREGRKAQTFEASLMQDGKSVARCTGLFLKTDSALVPPGRALMPPAKGPSDGRAIPAQARSWSPFFTGVDTRVVEGDLMKQGPASAWFHLERPLVLGEENSPLVHATSAADLASGISSVVDIRAWSFVNADLTMVLWRVPRAPWILLAAEMHAGDRGTGMTSGVLSDVDGQFGRCEQTVLFDKRP
jgi:hypothetical protein